ncbi:MAG: hypothetical protein ACTHK7_21590, partial [Aureliella sp.]
IVLIMLIIWAATGKVGGVTVRYFGWKINPHDGKLEYVVQLSPQNVKDMTSAAQEKESDVPTEVAARLSRVVVRIGTEPIVSTPMEEVMKLPPVTTAVLANIEASAGRGRFSQLESALPGEVRNVGGDGTPPSLAGSPSALPEAPGTSLADQASQLGSSLSDAIRSDISGAISSRSSEAMRNAQNLLAQNLAQNTPGSSLLSESRGSGTGKFANTATQPATPAAGSQSTGLSSTALPSSPSSSLGSPATAGNYPTSPAHNHAPGDGFHNDGTAAAPPLNSSIGSSSPLSGGLGNAGYPANNGSLSGANSGSGLNSGQSYNGSSGQYAGGQASAYNQPSYNQPGYNNSTSSPGSAVPGYNSTANSGMTPLNNSGVGGNFGGGNFGGYPRGNATQAPYGQYATAGTGSSVGSQYPYGPSAPAYGTASSAPGYGGLMPPQYAPDPLSLPSGNQPPIRIADNRGSTSLPSTSGVTASSGNSNTHSSSHSDTGKDRKTTDDRDTADAYANSHSGMDNVLPVMFVLSLVVNFYLGMLIRKLLGRYRSLLSSVRSQAV